MSRETLTMARDTDNSKRDADNGKRDADNGVRDTDNGERDADVCCTIFGVSRLIISVSEAIPTGLYAIVNVSCVVVREASPGLLPSKSF